MALLHPRGHRLQDRVGLIAFFHIGAHERRTPDELLAPSLRTIIESPAFDKAGVGFRAADFRALHKFFGLKPQGAVDISHLRRPSARTTTRIGALERLVRTHLGLPLDKGNGRVRTSNWSRGVLSGEQRAYAANDAYAGLMLYHYLDARRRAMDPAPPRVLRHERYAWFDHVPGRGMGLLLQLDDEEGDGLARVMKVSEFFEERRENVYVADLEREAARRSLSSDEPTFQQNPGPGRVGSGASLPATTVGRRRCAVVAASQKNRGAVGKRTATGKSLLQKLKDHREKIAKQRHWEPYMVAQNSVLEEIAKKKPRSIPELKEAKGMDKNRTDKLWRSILEHRQPP